MPINADNSPNIKWPLPEGKPAFSVFPVFSPKVLAEIKETVVTKAIWGPESESTPYAANYHTITGRWHTEVEFSKAVWDEVEAIGREKWEKPDLRLKVIWLSRYQQYKGITPYLWTHMDQPATQYTADICIESVGITSWGLNVDGQRFEEQENSGVFFMGQQQTHSRPEYPVDDKDAYITLLFANFASPDHWVYDIDCYSDEGNAAYAKAMEKYKLDGDIRYYELMGNAPYFDRLPKNNTPCEGCLACSVVDPDFTNYIEGYKPL